MDIEIRKSLECITGVIEDVNKKSVDLSLQISDESSDAYKLQEELRVATRSFLCVYLDLLDWGSSINLDDNREIFGTFRRVRDLFGTHPFHHVIEGRIAEMIKEALKHNSPVPPEFQDDYRFFNFRDWNNPCLNYNSIDDLVLANRVEEIPPEYRLN